MRFEINWPTIVVLKSKLSRYEQKQLYDIVADVGSYPRFLPFCTGSRIVTPPLKNSSEDTNPAPFVMEAELTVGFLAFQESYVSQVSCNPYKSVEVSIAFYAQYRWYLNRF